ncbi:hypothetical protein ACP70R_020942 [Stipagrostis hirtigluma subsp. patula]
MKLNGHCVPVGVDAFGDRFLVLVFHCVLVALTGSVAYAGRRMTLIGLAYIKFGWDCLGHSLGGRLCLTYLKILQVGGSELSRFKLLSVDDLTPTAELNDRHDGDENGEESIGKRTYVIHKYQSTDDDSNEDKDHPFGDPFVKDGFGNLTDWRLSDLNAEFSKLLEKESSKLKTKENKLSKEEKLKMHNDCMKHYMKYSLQKYNNEQHLSGAMCFEFVETVKESSVVEEDFKFYHHFNFMAKQTCSTAFLFFAEVIPDGDYCEVTNCKLLVDDDDERCFGCKNQGNADLRHPGGDNVYVGGHEDCVCPFFIDSDSEMTVIERADFLDDRGPSKKH